MIDPHGIEAYIITTKENWPYVVEVHGRFNSHAIRWCIQRFGTRLSYDKLEDYPYARFYLTEKSEHYFFKDQDVMLEFALTCA
jgi:hypothetical protein